MRTFSLTLFGLLVWTAPVCAQRPSSADAAAIIELGRNRALAYAHSLPDFVCTEMVRRFRDNSHAQSTSIGSRGRTATFSVAAGQQWVPTDRLTVRLSFFQQKEDHKLILVNDRPTDLQYEGLTGATVHGEFGGTLQSIFDPASHTAFRWEGWKKLRNHRIAAFAYEVAAATSQYLLAYGAPGHVSSAIVGFHGVIEFDGETGDVLHFTYVADHIPKELKLESAVTTVDYDFADVGGRDYLLPVRAETEIHSPPLSVKNETEFREYHKYSTSSVIDFGK